MFTPNELQMIAALINRAPIKGEEAIPVAILLQKITSAVKDNAKSEDTEKEPEPEPEEDKE